MVVESRDVVTCFLRNRGEVLLLKRSDAVDTYPGQWGAVSGLIEDESPLDAAYREIEEETGLHRSVDLVRIGDEFTVEDEDLEINWRVHSFLFDCESRDVEFNVETEEHRWVMPTEINRMECVPDLWRSYQAVAPSLGDVEGDTERGSTYITSVALEVLRDEAYLTVENNGDWGDLVELARSLIESHESMVGLRNAVNMAMSSAEGSAINLEGQAHEEIQRVYRYIDDAVEAASDLVEGSVVLTISRSGTLLRCLEEGDPELVVVCESRPRCEGVDSAEELFDSDLDVVLTTDAAAAEAVAEYGVDLILIGADSIQPDGGVVNKAGSRMLGMVSLVNQIPFYVVSTTYKVSDGEESWVVLDDEELLYDGSRDIEVWNPVFDYTLEECVSGFVTEDGVVDAGELREHAEIWSGISGWMMYGG